MTDVGKMSNYLLLVPTSKPLDKATKPQSGTRLGDYLIITLRRCETSSVYYALQLLTVFVSHFIETPAFGRTCFSVSITNAKLQHKTLPMSAYIRAGKVHNSRKGLFPSPTTLLIEAYPPHWEMPDWRAGGVWSVPHLHDDIRPYRGAVKITRWVA